MVRKSLTDEHTRTSVNSALVSFIAHLSTLLVIMAYSFGLVLRTGRVYPGYPTLPGLRVGYG